MNGSKGDRWLFIFFYLVRCFRLRIGRWRREEEGGLALRELDPEIVDSFGASGVAPRGEGAGGKAGFEPIREGFRRGKDQGGSRGIGAAHRRRGEAAAAEVKTRKGCGEGVLDDDKKGKGGGKEEEKIGGRRGREKGGEEGGS